MFAADDEIGACSLSAAQDPSCIRILPEISDVLPRKEPCDGLHCDSSSVLHDVHTGSGVGCHQVCRKQDLDCHTDVHTAAVSPSVDKLLPSLHAASLTNVDSVTVADIHVTDGSPQEKLLPSLCDTNPSSDNCDNPADADSSRSPREKLLPSLCDSNPTTGSCDNHADTVSQPLEKLLPSLSDAT